MDALRVRQGHAVQGDQESRGGRECRVGVGRARPGGQRRAAGLERRRGGAGAGRQLLGGAEKALGSGVSRGKRGENRVFGASGSGWGCVTKQRPAPLFPNALRLKGARHKPWAGGCGSVLRAGLWEYKPASPRGLVCCLSFPIPVYFGSVP